MTKIKRGDFIIENPDSVEGSSDDAKNKDKNKDKSSPVEIDGKHSQNKIPDSAEGETGDKYRRTIKDSIKSNKRYSSKLDIGKGGSKSEISSKWERAKSSLSSNSSLSQKAKSLLDKITSNVPKVNWKKEFKKFMDSAFNKYDYRLPNRRTLGSGLITYGMRKSGSGTLKTLALAVDTSGSITKDMISVFFEETWRLSTLFDIDEIIIIYASDGIDNIDRVKRGKKPDLTKWASTGGNSGGFHHPFKWLKDNKIIPSAFIYFTDTWAEFPSESLYGISKYKERVFWFICKSASYNKPPFGRSIVVNMNDDGTVS